MRHSSDVHIYRESAKLFVSSKILSGLGSVASQEIGELVNSWVQRPGQAWSVIFTASEHGYQVSTGAHNMRETCRQNVLIQFWEWDFFYQKSRGV